MKPIKRSIDIYTLTVHQLGIIYEALQELKPEKFTNSEIREVLTLIETLDAIPGHQSVQIEIMY